MHHGRGHPPFHHPSWSHTPLCETWSPPPRLDLLTTTTLPLPSPPLPRPLPPPLPEAENKAIRSVCGRYASYWNACEKKMSFEKKRLKVNKRHWRLIYTEPSDIAFWLVLSLDLGNVKCYSHPVAAKIKQNFRFYDLGIKMESKYLGAWFTLTYVCIPNSIETKPKALFTSNVFAPLFPPF